MSDHPAYAGSSVIPCLRYRDAPRAIDWLCSVFGFVRHLVVEGENGAIAHAQLNSGSGMIMLGSVSNEGAYGKLLVQPEDIGGAQTQTTYLVVADADAVYGRVLEAGAAIVIDIVDEEYGGRGFTCRDLEGHIWSIGTYDPWQQ
ncbi:glyoxalase [Massilia eurypsychrophila]|uniref:Glyoxalase n=1 Tax=Massilia eurypsychrophila TaxID=1485217 RepID=A0A2G8TGU0_9BURK|nr:VOC family protein [Massilia eurypsychrophila]PIL45256.1 glyoxalase [Massilia eurypsychrophila]